MIFTSIDGRFGVQIENQVISQMKEHCLFTGKYETGGILIGKYSSNLNTAIVSLASGPPNDSRHGKYSFYRGIEGLSELLKHWEQVGNSYYLGEWHFHPFASPNCSWQDIAQMRKIAKNRKYNCPEPIMLLVGGDPEQASISINAYIFLRAGKMLELNKAE